MCKLPMTIMSAWSGLQCAAIDRAYRSEHVRVAYDYLEHVSMCGLPMTTMSAWSGLQCAAIDRAYRS